MNDTLPTAPIRRIMKNAGCNRISEDALKTMNKYLVSIIEDCSVDAKAIANYAGRNTIRAEDIEFVI